MPFEHPYRRVIAASLECIKKIISQLDNEAGVGNEGLDYVLNQFSPSEILDNPLGLLDSLVLYLFHMHKVDWYSSTWVFGAANRLTVREGSNVIVMASEEGFVEKGLAELRERTEQFLQVLLQPKSLFIPFIPQNKSFKRY